MDKIFLLLGGNILNFGIYQKFKNKGYKVYVVDWNENPQIKGDKHYQLDVKDSESIIKALKEDNILNQVEFAYSSIDLAVPSVARVNKALGLNVISDDALKFATSKSMMTSQWAKDGILNRISEKYNDFSNDIYDLNKKMKLIIKPDNSASSRGITIIAKNSDEEFIKNAFEKAKKEATNSTVVVEEFVEGTEFTVEMLGDKFGNVSVYAMSRKTHTQNTSNNKIAVKLHYNSVSDELQNKIADFAIKCYKSLGFSSSLGHLEILLKEDGTISPVEIGARSSGFIASDLVDIASGRDFLGDLEKIYKGEKTQNGLMPQSENSSMYFFYDFPSGTTVKKECNLLDFTDKSIKSRYSNRTNLVLGKSFENIDNDNARLGFEILEGPKKIMTRDYINEKEQEFLKELLGV